MLTLPVVGIFGVKYCLGLRRSDCYEICVHRRHSGNLNGKFRGPAKSARTLRRRNRCLPSDIFRGLLLFVDAVCYFERLLPNFTRRAEYIIISRATEILLHA